jgi:hypothetical protein
MAAKTAKKPAASAADAPDLMGMFTEAAGANAPAAKAKKDDTIWFALKNTARVTRLSAMKWALKTLAAAVETDETAIKADVRDEYYIAQGLKLRSTPANCKTKVAGHVIGFQMKKRSSASGLTDDEIVLCKDNGIPLTENVTVQPGLMINPEHLNQETLKALSALIAANPDKLPRNLITAQVKVAKTVVTDDALDAVFKLPEDKIRLLLPIVGVQAITYGAANMTVEDFAEIKEVLFPTKADVAA